MFSNIDIDIDFKSTMLYKQWKIVKYFLCREGKDKFAYFSHISPRILFPSDLLLYHLFLANIVFWK